LTIIIVVGSPDWRHNRWHADPKGWRPEDFLVVSIEAGAVKETYFWEMPLF
jgi:hypothetical protein